MPIARQSIQFIRRGKLVCVDKLAPTTSLLDYLRMDERAVGTKEGCAEGDCGACTVVLGRLCHGNVVYEPVNACTLLLGQADGSEVITVEDLAVGNDLHPVQAAMVEHNGSQCGFCTPGIVMSLFALYQGASRPVGRRAVLDALAGNLCRCTGYKPIVNAALQACAAGPQDRHARTRRATASRLAEINGRADLFVGDENRFFTAPASEEALAALYVRHPEATLVGGCTDVGLWLTKGLANVNKVIWLGRVEELRQLVESASEISIGATVTLADVSTVLASVDPDLGELVRRFGSHQVRAVGTVGGNIANGSPIGDLAPAMIALGATVELRRAGNVRDMPLERFFLAYRKQDRRESEFVRRLTVPRLKVNQAFRCFKVSKRFDEDISAVVGAFALTLDGRSIVAARIAFGGMAEIPKRAGPAEDALTGASLDRPSSWDGALQGLAACYQPLSDQRASAAYRALVARNLLKKALVEIASGNAIATRLLGNRRTRETMG